MVTIEQLEFIKNSLIELQKGIYSSGDQTIRNETFHACIELRHIVEAMLSKKER